MMHMKIVWKDTKAYGKTPIRHRGHVIEFNGMGWTTDMENDDNIYKTRFGAERALDERYGFEPTGRRANYDVEIIGKKEGVKA